MGSTPLMLHTARFFALRMRSEADVLAMYALPFSPLRGTYLILAKNGVPGLRGATSSMKGASMGSNAEPDPKPGVLPPSKRCDG